MLRPTLLLHPFLRKRHVASEEEKQEAGWINDGSMDEQN